MHKQNLILGALLVVASELMFASMAATIKLVSLDLPSESVVFFRNLFFVMLLFPWYLRKGMLEQLKTKNFHWHIVRSLGGLGAMYCFFYIISRIPLADAALLKMTSPLFMPLIGLFWLGESLSHNVRWAIVIGFVGVAVLLQPEIESLSSVTLIALLGSAFAAFAKSTIRYMSKTEPSMRVVFYFALICLVVSSVPMFWSWVTPAQDTVILLICLSGFGLLGQILMTRAFMSAPVGQMGVFTYVAVIFAGLYGWIFWSESIDLNFLIGAGMIIFAGLLITYGNKYRLKKKAEAPLQTTAEQTS